VLHGVSFDIERGETLGLVGESGSGKTTIGRAILGLAPISGGTIRFNGQDLSSLPKSERRNLAEHMQVVFQDPFTSLNPAMQIVDVLSEPLIVRRRSRRSEARRGGSVRRKRPGYPSCERPGGPDRAGPRLLRRPE
jgi:ABC-type glutathione transport system ATPase component